MSAIRGMFWLVVGASSCLLSCSAGFEQLEPSGSLSADVEEVSLLTGGDAFVRGVAKRAEQQPCEDSVEVYREGEFIRRACVGDGDMQDLSVIDLGDGWAPEIFGPEGQSEEIPSFRPFYTALANEEDTLPRGLRVRPERYLELYGVFPTLRVVAERFAQAERCGALPTVALVQAREGGLDLRRLSTRRAKSEGRRLQRVVSAAMRRHGVDTVSELDDFPRYEARIRRLAQLDTAQRAVSEMKGHLRCEELLGRGATSSLGGRTMRALRQWQKKHMVVNGGAVDDWTLELMALGVEERVFRTGLRVLRERVVAALGLIEDGSASGEPGTVFGRALDAPEIRVGSGIRPRERGALDLVSRFTEAAAQELGWTSPAAMRERLRRHESGEQPLGRVGLQLPALPSYYSEHMQLRAEIDRGDVRRSRARPGDQRPVLTLFVESAGEEVALVQWNTTIGGWQSESLSDGRTVRRYKESPSGERVWRDVVAAPVWFPPPSTPDRELVWRRAGRAHVKWSLFGPGPRSAYGLLMVMHHEPFESPRSGSIRMRDEGIRIHGSSRYGSILTGSSHGCHRLYNHLALRLGAFLVAHRTHRRVGGVRGEYRRTLTVETDGGEGSEPEVQELMVRLHQRGYQYELDPPVEVNVLPGREHGWSR